MSAIRNLLDSGQINEIDLEDKPPYKGRCLLVHGGKSDYVRRSDYEEIKKHFPNIMIHRIANGDHYLHVQSQEEFLEMVNEFILNF